MKRLRILLPILGLLSGLLLAVPISATALSATCIQIYEDQGESGDMIAFCKNSVVEHSVPNLGNVPHTQAGSCNAPVKIGDNWNDCVSSMRVSIATNRCIRVFRNSGYDNQIGLTHYGPVTNQTWEFNGSGTNDAMSSISFGSGPPGNCVFQP